MRRPFLVPPWVRARPVLGLNARNLLYVHGLNPRRHFPLADDKVATKRVLTGAGVPVPETFSVLGGLPDITAIRPALDRIGEFVIKPARGRQGGGILVITGRDGERYARAGGGALSWEELRRAMGDILFGVHSFGQSDQVLVERRIHPDRELADLARHGLPDIRVILLRGRPAMAMMRVPTLASEGRANLHRGAAGVALRLSDGGAFRAVRGGLPVSAHPDTGVSLTGFRVPLWREVLDVACRAAAALPLPYLGVDVVLDRSAGPLVMEANVRPGLEIQNVNGRGLRRRLERLDGPRREGR